MGKEIQRIPVCTNACRTTRRERERQRQRERGVGVDKQKAGDQAAIGTRAKRQSGDPCNNVCFVKTVSLRKS